MYNIIYYVRDHIEEYTLREERSLAWVGKKLDMSPQYFNQFLKKDKYSLEDLAKIAEFLNCEVDSLYEIFYK